MKTTFTVYPTSTTPEEIKPPRDGRTTLTIFNYAAADSVFFSDDVIATPENGLEIPAGGFIRFEKSAGDEVPQGNCWLVGATANRARCVVRQG